MAEIEYIIPDQWLSETVRSHTVFLYEDWSSNLCDVTLKARILLKEFLTLAVLLNDYLYKPQATGWICLVADLRTLQHNMENWISDEQTIHSLDAAISAIIEAEFALSCDIRDASTYEKFYENMEHAKQLIDFMQFQWTDEPKMTDVPHNEVMGVLYWP